jgi:hypothetical protein
MGARWYDAVLGRFLQADTIVPNPADPQSLNRYAYGLNNPVKYTDPSGHAECIDEECDLLQNPTNDDIIVRDVDDSPLYLLILEISQGSSSAAEALERILKETSGTNFSFLSEKDNADLGKLLHTNFLGMGRLAGDKGFAANFGDDYLYGQKGWGGRTGVSQQLGHFLTAVNMGRDGSEFFKRMVVGHEQVSDLALRAPVSTLLRPTGADIQAFDHALAADASGNISAREAALGSILDPGRIGPLENRQGNSLEDLRLSVRGWRLGTMVASGEIATNRQVANWIALNVAGGR